VAAGGLVGRRVSWVRSLASGGPGPRLGWPCRLLRGGAGPCRGAWPGARAHVARSPPLPRGDRSPVTV